MKRNAPVMTPAKPTDRSARVAERLADITRHSPTRAGLFHKVYYQRPSKALAVKAKCLDCTCWQPLEIQKCQIVTCPLWRVRPYQKAPLWQTEARGGPSREGTRSGRVRIAEGV